MNGYAGQILRVNLTDKTVSKEPLDPEVAEKFLGGRGLGAYILYTEVPKGADPLGPQNKLIASSGPLSGLLVPSASKMDWACKSPLTGGYASASVGGMLTAEMKYAGYDSIVVEGASETPVYLYVNDDEVEVRDATLYWGQGGMTAERALKDELGEEFQIATIGPAGENLVKYACIGHDFGRKAGRGGVGAVMGAKKLKAIAVRGTKGIPVADTKDFYKKARAMYKAIKENELLEAWLRFGTAATNAWANEVGAFPTRNFQSGAIEGYEAISVQVQLDKLFIVNKGCFACPMPCGKYGYSGKHGVYVEGPEYETVALLGGNVALLDMEDLAYANYLCDELGLDTISAGNAIGFAMECFQKGIITTQQTDGIELKWGDAPAIFTMIEKIANREGIGDILAEGVKYAAKQFGGNSEDFAMHIKGMEVSGYESRGFSAMLLGYMTCDVGAHHNRSWGIIYDVEVGGDKITPDKAAKAIELQHKRPLFDALGACRFPWVEINFDLDHYAPVMKAITGIDRSTEDLLKASERIWNLTRLYWFREIDDFGREWDIPPVRTWKDPVVSGPTKGKSISREDVEKLLDMYYEQRGWDEDGFPTEEKLAELGLADIATM